MHKKIEDLSQIVSKDNRQLQTTKVTRFQGCINKPKLQVLMKKLFTHRNIAVLKDIQDEPM